MEYKIGYKNRHYEKNSSGTDWRIFSTLEFNGLLDLKYFKDKRVTLDCRKKIILSNAIRVSELFVSQTVYRIGASRFNGLKNKG